MEEEFDPSDAQDSSQETIQETEIQDLLIRQQEEIRQYEESLQEQCEEASSSLDREEQSTEIQESFADGEIGTSSFESYLNTNEPNTSSSEESRNVQEMKEMIDNQYEVTQSVEIFPTLQDVLEVEITSHRQPYGPVLEDDFSNTGNEAWDDPSSNSSSLEFGLDDSSCYSSDEQSMTSEEDTDSSSETSLNPDHQILQSTSEIDQDNITDQPLNVDDYSYIKDAPSFLSVEIENTGTTYAILESVLSYQHLTLGEMLTNLEKSDYIKKDLYEEIRALWIEAQDQSKYFSTSTGYATLAEIQSTNSWLGYCFEVHQKYIELMHLNKPKRNDNDYPYGMKNAAKVDENDIKIDDFSKESLETIKNIKQISKGADLLGLSVIGATTYSSIQAGNIKAGASSPKAVSKETIGGVTNYVVNDVILGKDLEVRAGEALIGIERIERALVLQEIGLLLANHQDTLSQKEKIYWRNLIIKLSIK